MTAVPHDSRLSKSCSESIERSLKSGRGQSLELILQDGRKVTVSTAGLPACLPDSESAKSADVTCNTGPGQLVYDPESQDWHLLWKVDLKEIRRQHMRQDYLAKVASKTAFLSREMEKIADTFDWNEK